MNRDDRIIYLHFKGESVRDLSTQFDLPYTKVHQIVNSAKDEMAGLKAEVDSLNSQLRGLKERSNMQLNEVIEQLEQSKLDNIKLLVRLHRLKKKVEFLENKLDGFNQQKEIELEELRKENAGKLCQDSKILAWQAWKEKV